MTDTVDSVTRQIFEVIRNVAAPLFSERGFVDVSFQLSSAENLGHVLEAFDYAEKVCAVPEVVLAGFHEIRTGAERLLAIKQAGGMDQNALGFVNLQALNAAAFFQDARNGKTSFEG